MKQLLTILTLLISIFSFSQQPTFDWAKKWGEWTSTSSASGIISYDMTTDNNGNSYVLSYGSTQSNFAINGMSPIWGPTAGCGAISKFAADGSLIWVKFITKTGGTGGGVEPKAICFKNGFLYYTGRFGGGGGIYDFDFSPTSTTNTGGGSSNSEVFVSKIDIDGNFQWFMRYGGSTTEVNDIHVSNDLSVYTIGSYKTNFSMGAYSAIWSGGGGSDMYIAKINNAGTPQFLKTYGASGANDDVANSLTSDSGNNIYVTGDFYNTVNFDPLVTNSTLTATNSDFFIQKINSAGIIQWTVKSSGASYERGFEICTDYNDNIIISGIIQVSADFDFSTTGNYTLTANSFSGGICTFVCKINSNSILQWAEILDGSTLGSQTSPSALYIDQGNNIFVAGVFSGTIDFDPSINDFSLTSSGSNWSNFFSNGYVLKLNENGGLNYAGAYKTIGGTNFSSQYCEPTAIWSNDTSIVVSGSFAATTDFDPSNSNYLLTSNTSPNGYVPELTPFITRLYQCPSSISTINVFTCGIYNSPSGQSINASGIYTDTIPNAAGCDSIITINLTIQNPSTSTLDTISCTSYTAPSGIVHTTSGIFSDTIPNAAGCDSIITINLTITQPTTSSIAPNICSNSYTAPDGQVYSQSGTYTAIIPNTAGCDSTITINLTLTPAPIVNAGADQVICEGSSVTLSGTGATVYNWSDGIINAVAFQPPVGTHNYIVTGTSANGCTDIDTVTVFVTPLPIVSFTGENTVSCSPVTFSLTNTTPNALNCTWDISNGDDLIGCGSVIGTISQVGCHDVTLTTTDNNGCSNSFTAPNFICVEATPNATFTASPSSFSQPNEQIVFTNNSSGANTYFWDFGDSSPSSNLLDPTHVYEVGIQDSFVVELIAYSTFACTDTSYLTIYYVKSSDTDVFIPTGFSPNNDGENDSWTISGLENYPNAMINVFNRWGQLLFEGGPSNPTWNGLYLGELLPTADYYYIIDLGEGSKYNGVVTLKQ